MNIFKDKVFGNGSNYVYYKRLETDSKYKNSALIFAKASTTISKYSDTIKSINFDLPKLLSSQAAAEREKENEVLKRLDPSGMVDYAKLSPEQLINKINEVIGLGDKYRKYLDYLKNIYPNTQAKNISPVVSSYISGKIATMINQRYGNSFVQKIGNLVRNNATSGEITAYSEQLADQITTDFINDNNGMTQELLNEIGNVNHTLGEEYMVWKDLFNMINSDLSTRNEFIISIMNSLGLAEKIKKAITDVQKNSVKTGKISGTKTAIRTRIEATAAQTGGLMYEAINAAMQGFAVGKNGGKVYSTSRLSNMGTTDLLTLNIDFDYSGLVAKKIEELSEKTETKQEAIDKITNFTEYLKHNINDGFIIYGNDKSYRLSSLSNNSKYFHGGSRNIQELPSVMAQYNIPITQESVELIINTIPGAILAGNTQFQEFLTEALAGQVAKLLFDDWTTIGDSVGNFNAIHVFHLSGIAVPLSYLLQKMAEAAEEALGNLISHPSSYFKVNFNLPSSIKFPESSNTTSFISEIKSDSKKGSGAYLQMAWEAQRAEALASTFGIDFLSNFNQLISQLSTTF